jgi:4-amino-4-deoxy-L-arabinose transferase-like glycosyltransferase
MISIWHYFELKLAIVSIIFLFCLLYFSVKNIYCYLGLIILTFILRIGCGFYFSVTPISDFSDYWLASLGHINFKTIFSDKSPLTIVYYTTIIHLVDNKLWAVYCANALQVILQGFLLYKISQMLTESKRISLLASLLYICLPSLILYSNIVSSEIPFLTFELLAFYFLLYAYKKYHKTLPIKKSLFCLFLFGFAIGLMHLARNLGLIFLLPLIIAYLFIVKSSYQYKLWAGLFAILGFLVCLSPLILFNYQKAHTISINSNHIGMMSLLFGTNKSSNGGWNLEDIKLAYGPSHNYLLLSEDYDETRVKNEIIYRIFDQPKNFVKFVLTKKIENMWANDIYGYYWTIGVNEGRADIQQIFASNNFPSQTFIINISNRYYYIIMIAGVLGIVISLVKWQNLNLLIILPLLTLAGLHIFLEVQGRYHLPFMPFLCFYAAVALSTILMQLQKIKFSSFSLS